MRKCIYSNCLFGTHSEIPEGEEVLIGKSYYHPECAKIKNDIREIIDLFADKINPNVVFPVLTKTLNNLIFDKGIDSEMILFGLKYYIEHRIPLNYPGGLYYVIQNKDVQREWAKRVALQEVERLKKSRTEDENVSNNVTQFNWTPTQEKTLANLFD